MSCFPDDERDGWDSGLETGHVDGRRLAQLISAPGERRLFRAERVQPSPSPWSPSSSAAQGR
jgi:hypothetical protein